MENLDREHPAIREYLLGGLDEEGRGRIESRFMTDPDFKDAVLLVEDELFEDYAFGTLPPQEREGFARRFTSDPRHARRLRLVEGLKGRAGGENPDGLTGDTKGRRRTSFWLRRLTGLLRFHGSSRTLKLAFAAAVFVLGSLLILEVLPPGDYLLRLAGLPGGGGRAEDAGEFYFRVARG